MTHQQKLAFVRNYCAVLLNMQKVQHPWAGQIKKSDKGFTICPFDLPLEAETLIADRAEVIPCFKARPFEVATDETAPDDAMDASDDITDQQTPLHFFLVQFACWHNLDLGFDPAEMWQPSINQRLVKMVTEMWDVGCLDSDSYCLTHCDLDPGNIIVDIQADGIPKITGMID